MLVLVVFLLSTVTAVNWQAPAPYDPVWLASVLEYPVVPNPEDLRIWGWSWGVADEDVSFRLFTRHNPYEYQIISTNNSDSLRKSYFHFDKKVKVLVHGWWNHGDGPMPESIKEAYLNVSDLNIIVVDWGEPANQNYIFASYSVAAVGRHLTEFLNFLIDEGVNLDNVHLIGHSLGAHVVGIAGAYVKGSIDTITDSASYSVAAVGTHLTEFVNFLIYEGVNLDNVHLIGHSLGAHVVGIAGAYVKGSIDTITGLDPALPLFTVGNKDARLDKHDAKHVEVIHTCGGYLGFSSPLGHIDFYPNGGTRQPGCGWDYRGFCAHDRAYMFFAESIVLDVPFTAVRCESYDELYYDGTCNGTGETLIMGGFDIHYGKDGIYYLETNAESPFAKGDPNNWF